MTAIAVQSTSGLVRLRHVTPQFRALVGATVSIAALLGSMPVPASAQNRQDPAALPAVAVHIDQPPSIDGQLDEAVWRQTHPITDFRQREPDEGESATEHTEVRIVYTPSTLYFGITLLDSEPHLVTRSVLQREGPNQQDDRFVIALDTYLDRHNAYIFGMNPVGTQEDGLITDEGSPNWNWEGVYWSEAKITETGWTLEVAIPFSTLRYPVAEEPVMGLLLYRQIRRKNEEVFWPMMNRNYRAGMNQVSRYGTLRGL